MEKKEKIGMNTCFAYISMRTTPMDEDGFYTYSKDPVKVMSMLLKAYLYGLAEKVCDAGWEDRLLADGACFFDKTPEECMKFIAKEGRGYALLKIEAVLGSAKGKNKREILRDFAEKLRPLTVDLGTCLDYSVCCNLVEFLQFMRQFNEDVTVGELFDELLDGELDCPEIC